MTEMDTLLAKIAAENRAAEAKVKKYTAAEAEKEAAFLLRWSKGKPIRRQTNDSTFWAAGKWMTKLAANQARSLAEHGYAELRGDPTQAGATLIMKKDKRP